MAALASVAGALGGIVAGAVTGGVGGAVLGGAAGLDARNSTAGAVSSGVSAANRLFSRGKSTNSTAIVVAGDAASRASTAALPPAMPPDAAHPSVPASTPAAPAATGDPQTDALQELDRLVKCKTAYDILGVTQSATADEIRKAYRDRSRRYHPDRNPAPAAKDVSQLLNNAYSLIGDEEKRRAYDRSGFKDTSGVDLMAGITITRSGAAASAVGSVLGGAVGAGVGIVGGVIAGAVSGVAASVSKSAKFASYTLSAAETLRKAARRRLKAVLRAAAGYSKDGGLQQLQVDWEPAATAGGVPELRAAFAYLGLPALLVGGASSPATEPRQAFAQLLATGRSFRVPDAADLQLAVTEVMARSATGDWEPDESSEGASTAAPTRSVADALAQFLLIYQPVDQEWMKKAAHAIERVIEVTQRLSGAAATASADGEYQDPDFTAAAHAMGLSGIKPEDAPKSALGLLSLYSKQMSKSASDMGVMFEVKEWAMLAKRYEAWSTGRDFDEAAAMLELGRMLGIEESDAGAASSTAPGGGGPASGISERTTASSTSDAPASTASAQATVAVTTDGSSQATASTSGAAAGSATGPTSATPAVAKTSVSSTVPDLASLPALLLDSAVALPGTSADGRQHLEAEIAVRLIPRAHTADPETQKRTTNKLFSWMSKTQPAAPPMPADVSTQGSESSWQSVIQLPVLPRGTSYTIPHSELLAALQATLISHPTLNLRETVLELRVADPIAAAMRRAVHELGVPDADAALPPMSRATVVELPSEIVAQISTAGHE